jgi:hypothetical protein
VDYAGHAGCGVAHGQNVATWGRRVSPNDAPVPARSEPLVRWAFAPWRQLSHPRHWRGQRHPSGDAPGAFPRLRVVGDPREPPTQLDSGRQLSLLIEGRADRSGIGLGNDEHGGKMGGMPPMGKLTFVAPCCAIVKFIPPTHLPAAVPRCCSPPPRIRLRDRAAPLIDCVSWILSAMARIDCPL